MTNFDLYIDIHLYFTTPKGPNITPNDPPQKIGKTGKSSKEEKRVERKHRVAFFLIFCPLLKYFGEKNPYTRVKFSLMQFLYIHTYLINLIDVYVLLVPIKTCTIFIHVSLPRTSQTN